MKPGVLSPRADLDDPASYRGLDPIGMLGFAVNFPGQVAEAARIGARFSDYERLRDPRLVVISGMGGSAAVGDFLARLCEGRARVPFLVNRSYDIPACVGPETLFIASSHSGDTEETLAAAKLAVRRRARVLCITTGGELAALAKRRKLPLISIPQFTPKMPPRAALGYSLIPLVPVLGALELYSAARAELQEARRVIGKLRDRLHPRVPLSRNPAKQLAHGLFGKLPWVHGTAGIMSAAAYRWRCQFNENSKVLAYSAEYPELNHNEVVGWELPRELAERLAVVVLRRPEEPPRLAARLAVTREMMAGRAPLYEVVAEGRRPLAQLLGISYFADFVSIYLAFLNGVDPASICNIVKLKQHLASL